MFSTRAVYRSCSDSFSLLQEELRCCRPGLALALLLCTIACNRHIDPKTYLDRGNRFFAEGRYEDASLNFRKALQKSPSWVEPIYRLALADVKVGLFSQAYAGLRRAHEMEPAREDISIALADLCIASYTHDASSSKQLYVEAERITNELAQKDANSFGVLRLRGYLTSLAGNDEGALQLLRQANKVKPLQPDVVVPLLKLLSESGLRAEMQQIASAMLAKDKTVGGVYDVLYEQHLAAGAPDLAEQLLHTRIRNNPKDSTAALKLCGHYAATNQASHIEPCISGHLRRSKEFPLLHLEVANFWLQLNKPQEATRVLEDGIRTQPSSRVPYQKKLAEVLVRMGEDERAIDVLKAYSKSQPTDLEARLLCHTLQVKSASPQETARGLSELKALVKEYPWFFEAHIALGKALTAMGDSANGSKELYEAVKVGPNSPSAHLALGWHEASRHNYQAAMRHADQVLETNPANLGGKLLRSSALLGLQHYDLASKEIQRILESSPNNHEALLQSAMLDVATAAPAKAEATLTRIYVPRQVDKRVAVMLAEIFSGRGELEKANALLQGELGKPENIDILLALTRISFDAGKYQDAVGYFERLPGQMVSLDLFARISQAYQFTGNLEKAIAVCRRALAAAPDNVMIKNNLAYLLAEQGQKLDEALQLVQEAQRHVSSNSPVLADTLAWIYVRKGTFPEAVRILEGLSARYPQNATYQYHLGVALLKSGDRDKASRALRSALKSKPSSEAEQQIRTLLNSL